MANNPLKLKVVPRLLKLALGMSIFPDEYSYHLSFFWVSCLSDTCHSLSLWYFSPSSGGKYMD